LNHKKAGSFDGCSRPFLFHAFVFHRQTQMPDPGQIYYLPPEPREQPGKGYRPHLTLSLCPPGSEAATFAYGSTRSTDAVHGAAHVVVDPFATRYRGTGLSQPTYFYPSRLISRPTDSLPEPSGRIIDELPAIRQQLRFALGLGQGVTTERSFRGSNRRGRIAVYSPWLAEEMDATHCVVVTEPNYSRTSFQQTTIPILNEADYETRPGDVVLRRTGSDWLRAFSDTDALIFAVPMIISVYERDSIARYLGDAVSERTMRDIDAALVKHFGL
jgi:hypothetical protein